MRVLVGEDDQSIAEVVTIILENDGHEVLHAPDEKTLRSFITKIPDLILLDISLGGGDGGEIIQSIKKDLHYSTIPVVIVSANSDTENIAKNSGADGFLLKPFEMDELLKLVSAYSPKPLS